MSVIGHILQIEMSKQDSNGPLQNWISQSSAKNFKVNSCLKGKKLFSHDGAGSRGGQHLKPVQLAQMMKGLLATMMKQTPGAWFWGVTLTRQTANHCQMMRKANQMKRSMLTTSEHLNIINCISITHGDDAMLDDDGWKGVLRCPITAPKHIAAIPVLVVLGGAHHWHGRS